MSLAVRPVSRARRSSLRAQLGSQLSRRPNPAVMATASTAGTIAPQVILVALAIDGRRASSATRGSGHAQP